MCLLVVDIHVAIKWTQLSSYDKLCSGYDIDRMEELMSAEKDEMALEAPTSEALYGCLGRFDRLGRKSSLISGGDGLPPPQPRNTSQSLAS